MNTLDRENMESTTDELLQSIEGLCTGGYPSPDAIRDDAEENEGDAVLADSLIADRAALVAEAIKQAVEVEGRVRRFLEFNDAIPSLCDADDTARASSLTYQVALDWLDALERLLIAAAPWQVECAALGYDLTPCIGLEACRWCYEREERRLARLLSIPGRGIEVALCRSEEMALASGCE